MGPVDTAGLVTSTSSGVLLGGCLAESPCWGASVNQGLVASPCTLVKNGEGTVSLACSSVWLSGGLTASPCWGAAVGTAADSEVFTSSFWATTNHLGRLLNSLAAACKS